MQAEAALWEVTIPAHFLQDEEHQGVWPENLPALEAYASVCTQWRLLALADGNVMAVGLDYPAVKAGLELAGIGVNTALWADLQMIEIGARAAMNGEKE
ncbi:DUF1799 domain-containing protein [Roseobacter sp. S98]|uniref:DUF1799 domain-containing protein n=1 Tax=Roseobacter algicola (ex Choi et al. 2025) (nom. illeg.) TaxID=3092138 RepID=UPI0035C77114